VYRAMLPVLCLSSLLCAVAGAYAGSPEPVRTRWMAPPGVERLPHRVWEPTGAFAVREVATEEASARAESGRVALLVEDALYPGIEASLAQYRGDLSFDGYSSITSLTSGGTPENLRTYIIGLYNEPESLVGAVLIGDLPYIIFEEGPEYEDFPCDLFFMDMDGTWLDDGAGGTVPAGNGKYDVWNDVHPRIEIWAGRMKVDTLPLMGAPAGLLNTYFAKNHTYRMGGLLPDDLPARGLVYVDDDWGGGVLGLYGDAWCVKQVYGEGNVVRVFDEGSDPGNNATAGDYIANHMTEDYQLVMLRSHGYPGGHGFYQDNRSYFGYVYNRHYESADPKALFYSLFVCSGCDYTAEYGQYLGYLGGTITFNEAYGLVAWGSTKAGGMWNDKDFYSVLAGPNTFGAAFVNWFNISHALYSSSAPSWWYGMVLIGDPTLVPNGNYATAVADGNGTRTARSLENRPNPFNPETRITFSIDRSGLVSIRIYDVSGRCVRTLAEREMPSGTHSLPWDGTGDGGVAVATGIYLCRLEQESARPMTLKMLLLK